MYADARRTDSKPEMTATMAAPLAFLPAAATPLLQTPAKEAIKKAPPVVEPKQPALEPCKHHHHHHHPEPLKPEPAPTAPELMTRGDRVLAGLLKENRAFVRGQHKVHTGVPSLRTHLATNGQKPTTCVVACADSRVAPEILFRAGLGELFVIRAAGNTVWGDEVLGSLEYAIDHLNVSVVMVLGHSKCGAVGAAVGGGDPLPGALGKHITGICKGIEAHGGCGDGVAKGVERNVAANVAFLRANPDGSAMLAERQRGMKIVGAVYDIEDGRVRLLDDGKKEVAPARVHGRKRRALRSAAGVTVRWAAATLPRLLCASVLLFNVAKCVNSRKRDQCAAIEA